MFGSDLSSGGGAPGGAESLRNVADVMARGQALVDTPRPAAGHPLAWHVEAMLVGDLTAVALAAVRASRSV